MVLQEAHRGKAEDVTLISPAQMQPNRSGHRQSAEQKPGIEQREVHVFRAGVAVAPGTSPARRTGLDRFGLRNAALPAAETTPYNCP